MLQDCYYAYNEILIWNSAIKNLHFEYCCTAVTTVATILTQLQARHNVHCNRVGCLHQLTQSSLHSQEGL